MAVPFITFQNLLWQFSRRLGNNPDPSISSNQGSGLVAGGITQANLADWTQFLNEGLRWCWHPDQENPETPWPYTVNTASIAQLGVITYDLVSRADWWRIWSADPRVYATSPTAYPIQSTADNGGIYPRAVSGILFVFYRPFRPQFTYVNPVAVQVYAVGDLVFDNQIVLTGTTATSTTITMPSTAGLRVGMLVTGTGIPANTTVATITPSTSITISNAATSTTTNLFTFGTGNVFINIVSAAGNLINDTTKFTAQTIPDALVEIILRKAEGIRLASKGNDPAKVYADADALMTAERARALPINGPLPPWDSTYSF